jgi:hypothetical protein
MRILYQPEEAARGDAERDLEMREKTAGTRTRAGWFEKTEVSYLVVG